MNAKIEPISKAKLYYYFIFGTEKLSCWQAPLDDSECNSHSWRNPYDSQQAPTHQHSCSFFFVDFSDALPHSCVSGLLSRNSNLSHQSCFANIHWIIAHWPQCTSN